MSLLQGAHDVNTVDPPLHCNVCIKKPDFSDVSHLLTHVASKGHLSSVFKLRVQANADPAAKRAIDRYDDWYADYNLDDLMAERLRQKESKRTSGGAASRRAGTASGSTRSTPAATNGPRRSNKLRDHMQLLDPQLNRSMRHGTTDPMSRSGTPASAFNGFDPAHFGRFAAPRLQNWAVDSMSNSPASTGIKQESFDSEDMDDDDYEDEEYELPVARATRRHRQIGSGSMGSYAEAEEEDLQPLTNEGEKLKGVKWPGMDMFDSATLDMKRKRNQKKNASVLRQLQTTSEIIEPTECVFDQSGTLRKQREITGNPPESEDDLIEGESEPEATVPEKKTRPRRQMPRALMEKSRNTSSQMRTRNQARTLPPHRRDSVMISSLMDDDDVKYDMTYGPPPKKRTGLSIHRDNSGPDITFDQPAALNYLTAGFHQPMHHIAQNPHQSQYGFNGNVVPRSHARQLSWGQFHGGFRPSSNSNGVPNMAPGGFGRLFSHPSLPCAGIPGTPSTGNAQPSNQPNFGMGSGNPSLPNPLFGGQTSQTSNNAWDMFNLDHDSTAGILGTDLGFTFHGDDATNDVKDGTLVNPLFVSDQIQQRSDDQATVSAGSDN